MSDDLTLLDANVLVYASFPASEYYSASRKILESAAAVFIYELEANPRYAALADRIFSWLEGPAIQRSRPPSP